MDEKYIKVIDALNDKPKFLFFPADLVFPCAGITAIAFVFTYIVLGLGMTHFVAVSVWLSGTWWILAGEKSYEFTDRLVPLPGKEYFNLNSLFVPATDIGTFKRKMTNKPKAQFRTNRSGKKEKHVPFQIESNLHSIMEIDFGEDKFAVLLKCDRDEWSATIPLALEGIHPELYDSEVKALAEDLSESLKDIPYGESITFMLGCRSSTRKRSQQLDDLSAQNNLPLINLLIASEKIRIRETTKKGFRQEWSQYAFLTWTQKKQALRKNNDLLSKFMNTVGSFLNSKSRQFVGTNNEHWRNIYIKLACEIYENSYSPWKINLRSKAKLSFQPLTADRIWEDLLWHKFNRQKAPPIPHLIKVTRVGGKLDYQIKVANTQHPKDTISVLLEGEKGRPTCPQHHCRRDVVAVNKELVAAMTLERTPKGWEDPREQLVWSWSKISDLTVRDTEIFLEISNGNKEKAHDDLVKISKQSTTSNVQAIDNGEGLNVAATMKQSEALEAQKRLHQGAEPLFGAMVVLVYRQNLEELQRACDRLANSFSPAKLIREEKICWKMWCETLPFNSLKLLKSTHLFTERRPILDSISIRGLLPISKPKNLHKDGFELINAEGGYPLHVDLFKNNERAIVTGKSGSGKSVLSFAIVKHALAQGIKVVGMDMSNAGESTFEIVTNLLGEKGSYINIVKRSFNILQPPNLSEFDEEKQEDRLRIWKNSVRKVIVSLAMGQIQDQELLERVDAIVLRLLNKFFNDDTIVDRYNLAFDRGWQSDAWQNMPVLEDLLFFCSREKLGIDDCKDIDERAINQINNQIEAKLIDPNIGRAISRPSDIPPEPDMKFFALSGLTNENNSFVMALVAQMACLNTALESLKSCLVMDECSVLLAKHGFSEIVGERFATGRKEGQSVLIIGQDIEAIVNCSSSSKIMTNTDYWLIGKTTSNSAESYVRELKIPAHIIYKNASESFQANKQYMYSNWLLCRDNRYWSCMYFPGLIDLAALANSPDEKAARQRILSKHPNTELGILEGLAEFSYELSKSFSSGSQLSLIGANKEKNHERSYDAA